VLPWIVVGALGLLFVLTPFFSWVGYFSAGYSGVYQGPWFAAFGWYNPIDPIYKEVSGFNEKTQGPHWMPLLFLYLLLLLPTLVLAIASAVLPMLPIKLPPQVDALKQWRWALVGGLALLGFLILSLQLLLGFSLESQARSAMEEKFATDRKEASTPEKSEKVDMQVGMAVNALGVERTGWLRLTFLLQFVAVVAAALQLWVEHRGAARPLPRLEMRW
jgi:hypothetical protein